MKDLASKSLDYSKHILMIQFQHPDIMSMASVASFRQKYVVENDWELTLLTDDVESWEAYFSDINIEPCSKYEDLYRDNIYIEYDDFAVRSDLLRTYYIWRFGGMYVDTDVIATKIIPDEVLYLSAEKDYVIFCYEEYSPEAGDTRYVTIPNAWFYSPYPKQIFMRLWLEGFMPEYSLWQGTRFRKNKPLLLIDNDTVDDHMVDHEAYRFEYSLYYPQFLSTFIPSKILKLAPSAWYYPKDIMYYIEGKNRIEDYPQAYGFHLWRSAFYHINVDYSLELRWLLANKDQMLSQLFLPYLLLLENVAHDYDYK